MHSRQPPATLVPAQDAPAPYLTMDGSTVRELMHPALHGNRAQSLAETRIGTGRRTLLHRHRESEEVYHVVGGRGEMTLGDTRFPIQTGDTVHIPPGTPHCVQNLGQAALRILCCCAPAYSNDDTELLEVPPEHCDDRLLLANEPTGANDYASRNYLSLRLSLGINQTRFWSTVLVTQSGGSRYENGRAAPRQVDTLVRLAYGTEEDARNLLASLRERRPADYKPTRSVAPILESGSEVRQLRKRMLMSQKAFWGMVSVTQSAGARYEAGMNIAPPVRLLLQLILSNDKQTETLMKKLRAASTAAIEAKL